MTSRPLAWLLSAYRSDSHAWWADWLQQLEEYDWRAFELPGRHFRWRIRGNPLSWLDSFDQQIPELIVATSMVDIATIRGLHPRLAHVPCLYYFHENQFAYPAGEHQVKSIEPQMVQLYGALAASACIFNSHYNLDSFIEGVEQLSRQLPDAIPDELAARIRDKSSVLPVAFEPVAARPVKQPGLILWNHRWEYDKQPELFAAAVFELERRGVDFQLALLGNRHEPPHHALLRLREELPHRIQHDKRADPDSYREILGQSAVVVSTAIHEFQGLAVLEAVSAGAIPVVPDALCYPEQYPASCRYPANDRDALVDMLKQKLQSTQAEKINVGKWYSEALRPRWLALCQQVMNSERN